MRLLRRGAIVTTAGPDGNTPLHLAAERGFVNVGKILLGDGAIIMARNNVNKTSLHLAIENHHSDFAVLMVKSMEPSRSVYYTIIDDRTYLHVCIIASC